jgi:hypothetical protein
MCVGVRGTTIGSGDSVGRTFSGRDVAVDDHHLYDDDGHGGWHSSSPHRPPRVSLENNLDDKVGVERKRRWCVGIKVSELGVDDGDMSV